MAAMEFSPAGKLIYAAARDVTEHKQMEEKIRKAAEEWQTTFDSVQDLVDDSGQGIQSCPGECCDRFFLQAPFGKDPGEPLLYSDARDKRAC